MNDDQVYPPAEDSYLLLQAVLLEFRAGDRILEIGTGSGIVSSRLSCHASAGDRRVLATDINPHAARKAYELGIEVVRADLFSGIRGPFDLVIFNPPYLPTGPNERIDDWLEYALDGGPEGRSTIVRFIRQVGRVLAPGGRFLIVVSSLTGIREVESALEEAGYDHGIVLEQMIEGERLVVVKGWKRSGSGQG